MPTTAQEVLAVVGVFDTHDAALGACTTPQHVMGPIDLNVDYNNVNTFDYWPGAKYPLAEQQ
jgi:hypothetical protein